MLDFLANSTHPELSFAVPQCAKFCNDSKKIHEQVVNIIIQYLLSTAKHDNPDSDKGFVFKVVFVGD